MLGNILKISVSIIFAVFGANCTSAFWKIIKPSIIENNVPSVVGFFIGLFSAILLIRVKSKHDVYEKTINLHQFNRTVFPYRAMISYVSSHLTLILLFLLTMFLHTRQFDGEYFRYMQYKFFVISLVISIFFLFVKSSSWAWNILGGVSLSLIVFFTYTNFI